MAVRLNASCRAEDGVLVLALLLAHDLLCVEAQAGDDVAAAAARALAGLRRGEAHGKRMLGKKRWVLWQMRLCGKLGSETHLA